MNSDSDDDALSWEGDDALEARPQRRPEPAAAPRPADARAASGGADAVLPPSPADAPSATTGSASADEPQGLSTASLVALGILGGVYLLYTVGWVIGGVGMRSRALFMMPAPLYQAGLWIAVLAPALWYAAVVVLTRGSKEWVRIVGLALGALLLVPWPFVVAGGGAL